MGNHLFARLCRVAGRFLLASGAIALAGAIAMVLVPLFTDIAPSETVLPHQSAETIVQPAEHQLSFPETLPYIFFSIVFVAAIIFAIMLVMRRYNDDIRNIIGKLARLFKLSIQITELFLTVFAWGSVALLTAFNAPLFSIVALCSLIINELFFIFAWTAYGCKNYTA